MSLAGALFDIYVMPNQTTVLLNFYGHWFQFINFPLSVISIFTKDTYSVTFLNP